MVCAAAKSALDDDVQECRRRAVSRHNHPSRSTGAVRQRPARRHGCWDHFIVAPLWVAYGANLGTLLRTCDAVGACLAVPRTAHYREALARGDTLPWRPCIHWADDQLGWLSEQRDGRTRVIGVELAEGATRLADLAVARGCTVAVLGHGRLGLPDEASPLLDEVVEIPMLGVGRSLNVAVAGSLVLYKLAGLS